MDEQKETEVVKTPEVAKAPPKVENMKITIEPKHNCKKCYGTGRLGFINGDQNNPMICDCVMKVYKKIQEQQKRVRVIHKPEAKPVDVQATTPAPAAPVESPPVQG